MIPKIIHYCWFGRGKMPQLADICINSWKKHLPEYELKLWNEDSFDINSNQFVREAYNEKKYAFITDYVRLYALMNYGGIYMDTDVEVLKSLNKFLIHDAFTGFEDDTNIPTGIMASKKNSKWIRQLLSYYDNRSFLKDNGQQELITNTRIITDMSKDWGFEANNSYQILMDEVHIYPKDFFCPKSQKTGKIYLTENSACIHHFSGSWMPANKKALTELKYKLMKIFGENRIDLLISTFKLNYLKKQLFK